MVYLCYLRNVADICTFVTRFGESVKMESRPQKLYPRGGYKKITKYFLRRGKNFLS